MAAAATRRAGELAGAGHGAASPASTPPSSRPATPRSSASGWTSTTTTPAPSLDDWLAPLHQEGLGLHRLPDGQARAEQGRRQPRQPRPCACRSRPTGRSTRTWSRRASASRGRSSRPPAARLLRRHRARRGQAGRRQGAWQGKAVWSNPLDDDQRTDSLEQAQGQGACAMPEKVWLTVFEDRASPRPGDVGPVLLAVGGPVARSRGRRSSSTSTSRTTRSRRTRGGWRSRAAWGW